MNYQKVIIAGRLARDAELRYLPTGTPMVSLSIPVSRNRKEGEEWKQETTWFNVVAFRETAERNGELTKGTLVVVEGRINVREWEDDNGKHQRWELVADAIRNLTPRRKEEKDGWEDGSR